MSRPAGRPGGVRLKRRGTQWPVPIICHSDDKTQSWLGTARGAERLDEAAAHARLQEVGITTWKMALFLSHPAAAAARYQPLYIIVSQRKLSNMFSSVKTALCTLSNDRPAHEIYGGRCFSLLLLLYYAFGARNLCCAVLMQIDTFRVVGFSLSLIECLLKVFDAAQ